MNAVTQWFDGRPPKTGWWDTRSHNLFTNANYEIRLWWSGKDWRASPDSPASSFHPYRQWRGLAEKPA